jgi:hypothetical protein
MPQRGPPTFFPWGTTPRDRSRGDPSPPIPREPRKSSGRHPPLRFGLRAGAASIAFGLSIAIEAAMGAGSKTAIKES